MCLAEYICYTCGHTSVPVLRACPLTTSSPDHPICARHGDRPFISDSMCPTCERHLHNRATLVLEHEHRWMHERGVCGCPVQFPGLLGPRILGPPRIDMEKHSHTNGDIAYRKGETLAKIAAEKKRITGPVTRNVCNGMNGYPSPLSTLPSTGNPKRVHKAPGLNGSTTSHGPELCNGSEGMADDAAKQERRCPRGLPNGVTLPSSEMPSSRTLVRKNQLEPQAKAPKPPKHKRKRETKRIYGQRHGEDRDILKNPCFSYGGLSGVTGFGSFNWDQKPQSSGTAVCQLTPYKGLRPDPRYFSRVGLESYQQFFNLSGKAIEFGTSSTCAVSTLSSFGDTPVTPMPPLVSRVADPKTKDFHIEVRLNSLYCIEWLVDHKVMHQKGNCHCKVNFQRYRPTGEHLAILDNQHGRGPESSLISNARAIQGRLTDAITQSGSYPAINGKTPAAGLTNNSKHRDRDWS